MRNLLRNPIVVGALSVVALGIVCYQALSPRQHARAGSISQAGKVPAVAKEAPGNVNAPSSNDHRREAATSASPPPSRGAGVTSRRDEPAREKGIREGIDRPYLELQFSAWVTRPKRDPFLLIGARPATPDKVNMQTNSPILHWTLRAIWEQTGSRVAVINHNVYREGDELEGYKISRIEGAEVWFDGPNGAERLVFDKCAGRTAPEHNAGPVPQSSAANEESVPAPRS